MAIIKPNNNTISAITALPAAIPTGKVLQVVQTTDGTQRETTSSSYVAIDNTAVNITPSSTSSKILITVSCLLYKSSGAGSLKIYRDSTDLGIFIMTDGDGAYYATSGLSFLDTPNSTSSLEYRVQFATSVDGATYRITINNYIRGSIRPKSSITSCQNLFFSDFPICTR